MRPADSLFSGIYVHVFRSNSSISKQCLSYLVHDMTESHRCFLALACSSAVSLSPANQILLNPNSLTRKSVFSDDTRSFGAGAVGCGIANSPNQLYSLLKETPFFSFQCSAALMRSLRGL